VTWPCSFVLASEKYTHWEWVAKELSHIIGTGKVEELFLWLYMTITILKQELP
jgi:hypothetical protein